MTATTTEDAIRRYLLLTNDPDKLIDHDTLEELGKKLEVSDDPVERIKIRAEMEKAKQPPTEELEASFIEHAKSWAEENNISTDVLIAEGADPAVLRQAGFHVGRGPRKTTRQTVKRQSGKKSENSDSEHRKGASTSDDVINYIRRRARKPFTMPDVVNAVGVSRSTAMKAVNQLIEAGEVEDTGEERESGRGRNAKIYQKTS